VRSSGGQTRPQPHAPEAPRRTEGDQAADHGMIGEGDLDLHERGRQRGEEACCPGGVTCTRRPARSNSGTPSCAASARICRETAEAVAWRLASAAVKVGVVPR